MINPGTLVVTSEGYYAIVIDGARLAGFVEIFACNGLRLIEHEDSLKPLGLKHDSASADPPASFHEIIHLSRPVDEGEAAFEAGVQEWAEWNANALDLGD